MDLLALSTSGFKLEVDPSGLKTTDGRYSVRIIPKGSEESVDRLCISVHGDTGRLNMHVYDYKAAVGEDDPQTSGKKKYYFIIPAQIVRCISDLGLPHSFGLFEKDLNLDGFVGIYNQGDLVQITNQLSENQVQANNNVTETLIEVMRCYDYDFINCSHLNIHQSPPIGDFVMGKLNVASPEFIMGVKGCEYYCLKHTPCLEEIPKFFMRCLVDSPNTPFKIAIEVYNENIQRIKNHALEFNRLINNCIIAHGLANKTIRQEQTITVIQLPY